MIIPRHKVCDLCGQSVGVNKRYYIIKSKDYIAIMGEAFGGSFNMTHHICEDCMYEICETIKAKADMQNGGEEE